MLLCLSVGEAYSHCFPFVCPSPRRSQVKNARVGCVAHVLWAAGSIDTHFTVSILDIAAGYLIVREAGGVFIDTGGWCHYIQVIAAGGSCCCHSY